MFQVPPTKPLTSTHALCHSISLVFNTLHHHLSHMQVFLTHLHSDHHADLATLYVGAMFGRKQPWEVWGPSGDKPELGTAAAIEGLRQVGVVGWVCGCRVGVLVC